MSNVKDMVRRASHRLKSTTGYRLLRTKRWGVDWLDDCIRLADEHWHPDYCDLDVIFDVGANTGQTARKILQRISPKQIVCFEPVAETFQQLKTNTAEMSCVECLPCGLSDEDSAGQIHIYSSSVLASTCAASPIMSSESDQFERTESIELRTLDSVCQERGTDSIDLLKVDTEGADLRTLRGAEQLLAARRIGLIVFEFYCPTSTTTENGIFSPVNSFLSSHGYRLISFYTDFVNRRQATGVYNALYMASPQ